MTGHSRYVRVGGSATGTSRGHRHMTLLEVIVSAETSKAIFFYLNSEIKLFMLKMKQRL